MCYFCVYLSEAKLSQQQHYPALLVFDVLGFTYHHVPRRKQELPSPFSNFQLPSDLIYAQPAAHESNMLCVVLDTKNVHQVFDQDQNLKYNSKLWLGRDHTWDLHCAKCQGMKCESLAILHVLGCGC